MGRGGLTARMQRRLGGAPDCWRPPAQAALEESFHSVLRARGLARALEADSAADDAVTPYARATALRVEALKRRFAAALRGLDEQLEQQAAQLAALRVRAGGGGAQDVAAAMRLLPSALTGAHTGAHGLNARAWASSASGAINEGLAAGLAAPFRELRAPVAGTLTAAADARLASRVAAMHRMALRAFAAAAAEAAAPEAHPESAAALAPAVPAAAAAAAAVPPQLRSAPAALRRCGRPTPGSRATLKAWMQAHFFPSATHPHGPFPSAAEKEALADDTGLSVNQVSDWFVNARARWWKPMIEGMHRGLCDPEDEPLAALPAVPEGRGDEEMAEAEAAAAAAEAAAARPKHRRRASSGVGRAPLPMHVELQGGAAATAAAGRHARRSTVGDDFGDAIAELGIEGGL
jgi:hypothetical protein